MMPCLDFRRGTRPASLGFAAVAALAALAALACHDPAGPPDEPRTERQIAFSAGEPGATKIYVVDADGTGLRMLTDGPVRDRHPQWTADGRRIRFWSSGRDGPRTTGLYEINGDGTGLRQLVGNVSGSYHTWSPDGRKVAFAADIDPGNTISEPTGLFVMDADGSHATRLLYVGASPCMPTVSQYPEQTCQYLLGPAWSPDGAWLAFWTGIHYTHAVELVPTALYVVRADGTGLRQPSTGRDQAPAWSPDGQRLAVSRFWESGLYVLPLGGGERTLLTGLFVSQASWAPDGRRLVLAGSDESHPEGLYVVNADGTGLRQIPLPVTHADEPSWNPRLP